MIHNSFKASFIAASFIDASKNEVHEMCSIRVSPLLYYPNYLIYIYILRTNSLMFRFVKS